MAAPLRSLPYLQPACPLDGRAGKLYLYYHGENDTTRVATSTDGIHFDYEKTVVTTAMYDGISESSYARVFPCTSGPSGSKYVILFMGNNQGTRCIYAAWSRDGLTFEAQRKPLINPPPGTTVTQVGAPWYLPWQGNNYVLFHGDKTPPNLSDVSSNIYAAEVGDDFTTENHLGVFLQPRRFSLGQKARFRSVSLSGNGETWMFMAVGPRLHQEIAVVKATL